MQEYFEANRANWDERAGIHARSELYSFADYIADPNRVGETVEFDRRWLGDISGSSVVHLQCHIGTDTLSLARLGATVTGVDQSASSLAEAERLFAATETAGTFVQSNVYDAAAALNQTYDLVYTGVGALNWLPDIDGWAKVVSTLLNPGGRLYLREGHPMMWALDDAITDSLVVGYPYFQTAAPMVFDIPTTYTEGDDQLANARTYEWNHGLGEIVTALLGEGLTLTALEEHRECEWPHWPNMTADADGRYRLPAEIRDRVPLMYSLVAQKP